MKHSSLLLFFLCLYAFTSAQDSAHQRHYTRNIAWTAPVGKPTTINGIAFSAMTASWANKNPLTVNGLNLEMAPLNALISIYAVMGVLLAPFGSKKKNVAPFGVMGSPMVFPDSIHLAPPTIVKGLSLSGGGICADLHGLGVNGFVASSRYVHGLEITGIMNMHYDFRGVIIAGLRNKTTTGKGLQIGLINVAKGGQIVQIGLFNRIGKRVIPFCELLPEKESFLK